MPFSVLIKQTTTTVMLHYLKHLIPILPRQSRKYSRQPINSSPWQFDQSYFFSRNKNSAERQSMKRWPDRSRRDISSVGSSAREKAYQVTSTGGRQSRCGGELVNVGKYCRSLLKSVVVFQCCGLVLCYCRTFLDIINVDGKLLEVFNSLAQRFHQLERSANACVLHLQRIQ